MDVNSKHIIHLEIGDSREVGRHSPKMERLLIERGLNYILNVSPYVVWEIISDASRNIISMMRKFISMYVHNIGRNNIVCNLFTIIYLLLKGKF